MNSTNQILTELLTKYDKLQKLNDIYFCILICSTALIVIFICLFLKLACTICRYKREIRCGLEENLKSKPLGTASRFYIKNVKQNMKKKDSEHVLVICESLSVSNREAEDRSDSNQVINPKKTSILHKGVQLYQSSDFESDDSLWDDRYGERKVGTSVHTRGHNKSKFNFIEKNVDQKYASEAGNKNIVGKAKHSTPPAVIQSVRSTKEERTNRLISISAAKIILDNNSSTFFYEHQTSSQSPSVTEYNVTLENDSLSNTPISSDCDDYLELKEEFDENPINEIF